MASPPSPPRKSLLPTRRGLGSLRMIWRYVSRYPLQIVIATLALFVSATATLFIPRTFQKVVDHGFARGANSAAIAPYFEGLLGVVAVLALATAVRFYFVSWLGERTVSDIRIAVLRNLLRLSPAYFEENRPSEIASRLTADTSIIEQAVGSTVSVALRNAVVGFGGLIYLFTLAPKLAATLIVGIPLLILPVIVLGYKVRQFAKRSQDRLADIGSTAVETLSAMKVVQAFGQQGREADRFAEAVAHGFATAKQRFGMRALMTALFIGMLFGGTVLLLWDAVSDVTSGRISGGSLFAFVVTAGIVTGAFGALSEVWGDLLRASGASERLGELLAEQPEIAAPARPVALPVPPLGTLAFEKVRFHYPTRPEVAALDGIDLSIRPGETVAVVGPSGAGKSTLFQLAERFYDPDGGRVLLDGIDLRDADPEAVRSRIALVPQETVIFGASARDNLRYGHWGASDDQLWAAAEAANAAEFLRKLPDGLDTFLGEGGARLSGGQRQRVTIARALLRDAPLLLLDEATSALDAESERLVQEALERLMDTRTTLVIAHRLATVRRAERIIVMEGGLIVEEGTHSGLIGRGGLYARLARLQFSEEVGEPI